jgi:hypothetical protein
MFGGLDALMYVSAEAIVSTKKPGAGALCQRCGAYAILTVFYTYQFFAFMRLDFKRS